MKYKTTVIIGTLLSAAAILLFHLLHLLHGIYKNENKEVDYFKNAKLHIMLTDSIGKKDTVDIKIFKIK